MLHHEVGSARGGDAAIEDLGHVRVIHDGQGLPLLLEARDDGLRVHARLDDLERHTLHHRLAPLGEVDDAEAAFADHFEQLVRADHLADQRDVGGGCTLTGRSTLTGRVKVARRACSTWRHRTGGFVRIAT